MRAPEAPAEGKYAAERFKTKSIRFCPQSGQKSVFFFVGSVGVICWNDGEKRQKWRVRDPLLAGLVEFDLMYLYWFSTK